MTAQMDTRVYPHPDGVFGHVTGFVTPFNVRWLSGNYITAKTAIQIVSPSMLLHEHLTDDIDAPLGALTLTIQDEGIYADAQLGEHPASAYLWREANAGRLFWSADNTRFRKDAIDADGWIARIRVWGASLCMFPYFLPNGREIDEYLAPIRRSAREFGTLLRPVNKRLFERPIREGNP